MKPQRAGHCLKLDSQKRRRGGHILQLYQHTLTDAVFNGDRAHRHRQLRARRSIVFDVSQTLSQRSVKKVRRRANPIKLTYWRLHSHPGLACYSSSELSSESSSSESASSSICSLT